MCRAGAARRRGQLVDSALLAAKIASVRDATARVRAVLPGSADQFWYNEIEQ